MLHRTRQSITITHGRQTSLPQSYLPDHALPAMHRQTIRAGTLFTILFVTSGIFAADGDRPRDLAVRIDRHTSGGGHSRLLNESAFIRRVTLDLAGRIPTVAELESFQQSDSLDKRAGLVQRLIESPDFAFHQRNELDTLLLRRLVHNDPWREYLLEATRENRSWDKIFRQVMSPEDECRDDLRPVAYLKERVKDLDAMANDSSILWFGVNVACAKCHDHPQVDDWKQAHYYGLASFFKRTFGTRKGFMSERFDGKLKYETTDGEEFEAEYMFLTGTKVTEPELQWDEDTLKQYRESIKKAERDENAEPPPRPEFRPRARLVDLALADTDQRFFAKNIANRIWMRMFGRGLVHPLDQMHSENPPSHPELLQLLCDDLVDNGYDLKRLIHAIALSDTYARQMRQGDSVAGGEIEYFASALPRPLTPHQLSLSLKIATSSPLEMIGQKDDEWAKRREDLEKRSENAAKQLEIPDDGFQVPIAEALWFNNNQTVQNEYLSLGSDRLVGYLAQMKSNHDVVSAATRSILSREPETEEQATMIAYLDSRAERRVDAIQHVVWALICSPEFRFNH
jgi:hypothetical protein